MTTTQTPQSRSLPRAIFALAGLAALLLLPAGADAAAPTITETSFSHVTTTSLTLEAKINPNSKATSYHFAYGSADCTANPCTTLPEGKEPQIGNGTSPVTVQVPLSGLSPHTTYHFIVVAKNVEGTKESPDQTFTTFLPPPTFGPCPNDLFRTGNPSIASLDFTAAGLPDCRAYELATPLDKDGGNATGDVRFANASAAGDRITFVSSGGAPGGVGSQDIPTYLASREGEAWTSRGMLPPATAGEQARVLGWTPNLSEVFTQANRIRDPSQAQLLVTFSDGTVHVIASVAGFQTFYFAGTSADGSLYFESTAKLTPDALEGKHNAYLWDRPSDQVHLVSIENDGSPPAKGAFAGPYDWTAGTNGASLSRGGSEMYYFTQRLRVLAADRSAAYFTAAGTGQLYERLNPTQTQSATDTDGNCTEPAKACTIRVSASQKTNGLEPDGTERGGPRPAAFQGASSDGRYSFFTSSEQLTDDANTGPEPTELPPPPTISRSDLQGEGIVHSYVPARAVGLAVDAKYIYWADPEANAIGRAALDGSTDPEPGFITGLPDVEELAVDQDHIYWAEPSANSIGRATIEGHEVKTDFITGAENPRDIALDGTYVYWTNPGNEKESFVEHHHAIGRALLNGTAVDQSFIDLEEVGLSVPKSIAVGAGHIYLIAGSLLLTYGVDGSQQWSFSAPSHGYLSLASGNGFDLGVGLGFVYWSQEGQQASESVIKRAQLDLDLSDPEFIVSGSGIESAPTLALDASHLYWANNPPQLIKPGNDLYRFDSRTGAIQDLTSDSSEENGAGVRGVLGTSADGSYVYFAANGVLAPGGLTGSCKGASVGGEVGLCNLYVWHDGDLRFIATIDDRTNWLISRQTNTSKISIQDASRITPDGTTVVFRSRRNLTEFQSAGEYEFYRYYAPSEQLSCLTCSPSGQRPSGSPWLATIRPGILQALDPAAIATHNLSDDGDRFFFETPDRLVAADHNGDGDCPLEQSTEEAAVVPTCQDVYMWEAQGSGTCIAEEAVADGGCLYLLSTGTDVGPGRLADVSATGDDAFIYTRARLAGVDQDNLLDIYDVRVDAMPAAQNPPPPPVPCEAEGCRPLSAPHPTADSAGSAGFVGPPDPQPKHHNGHKHKKRKHKKPHPRRHRRSGREHGTDR